MTHFQDIPKVRQISTSVEKMHTFLWNVKSNWSSFMICFMNTNSKGSDYRISFYSLFILLRNALLDMPRYSAVLVLLLSNFFSAFRTISNSNCSI